MRFLDMDTHIGDLHPTIVGVYFAIECQTFITLHKIDQEIEIVQCLLDQILVSQDAIENACEIYAELDCLLSFAQASRAYNYRRPILVDDNIIEITGGRSVGVVFQSMGDSDEIVIDIRCTNKSLIHLCRTIHTLRAELVPGIGKKGARIAW
jgi:hypothetical protein